MNILILNHVKTEQRNHISDPTEFFGAALDFRQLNLDCIVKNYIGSSLITWDKINVIVDCGT